MKVTKAADAHVNIIDVPTPYYNICDILDTDTFNTKCLSAMVRLISFYIYAYIFSYKIL